VKSAYCLALQSLGNRRGNRWALSLVLNDRRQLDDVTSDGKLFLAMF